MLQPKSKLDMDKFRLRRFVEKLIGLGEVEVHDEPVALAHLSGIIEATPKAVLFRNAGPERVELVSSVAGGRGRIAAALGTTRENAWKEYLKRLDHPQPVLRVGSADAPVQEVVIQGDAVDLTRLPFHPQHECDGSTYLTSGIDYTINPETGMTNVGCRRLSLRNKKEVGTNLTAPSDLRQIYLKCAAKKQRLAVSFAVGSHPLDFMAAGGRLPAEDETTLVSTLRGEPVPLVKCLTNDIWVPADAEMILEGYLDERGYCEPEGPYGEYMGYYGPMHMDPVFHVTAITQRRDMLHQSLLHGSGKIMERTDSQNIGALRNEAFAMKILKGVIAEPVAVHNVAHSGGNQELRVAIRQRAAGDARRAIHALFAGLMQIKHIFVVDADVDVFDDHQMDWALSTRFQADRDLVLVEGLPGMRMDPSLEGRECTAKAGFDCTVRFGRKETVELRRPQAASFEGKRKAGSVREALAAGPLYFTEIMNALGSLDGREVACEIDALRQEGVLCRNGDGQYFLGEGEKGRTRVPEGHKGH